MLVQSITAQLGHLDILVRRGLHHSVFLECRELAIMDVVTHEDPEPLRNRIILDFMIKVNKVCYGVHDPHAQLKELEVLVNLCMT